MNSKASIALFAALISLAAAEPKPGDADFPTRSATPRHEEKVAAVKSGDYDLVLIGDLITHTLGELNDGSSNRSGTRLLMI